MKIPDAIVYATAKEENCILVTRNTKDLKEDWPDIRVPYVLQSRRSLRQTQGLELVETAVEAATTANIMGNLKTRVISF